MTRTSILLTVLCFFCVTFAPQAFSQKPTQKPVNVAGEWDVTVKMPTENVAQKWTIRQVGDKISGTAKTAQGEFPITGEMVTSVFFRVSMKDGDNVQLIRATADKDSMDGSITIDRGEYVWSAKRSK